MKVVGERQVMSRNIKRIIENGPKYNLVFYMREPSVILTKNNSYCTSYNPRLYFSFNDKYINGTPFDDQNKYVIYPWSIYRVIRFFNEVLEWFYDDNKKDLFLLDEDNHLIFNADYRELSKTLDISFRSNSIGILRAIPTVGVRELSTEYCEGIFLYMNQSVNRIFLSKEELSNLLDILSSFSFYNETLINLEMIRYCKDESSIESSNENIGEYNTAMPKRKTPFDI